MKSKKITLLIALLTLISLTGLDCNKPKDLFVYKTANSGQNWEQKALTDNNKSLSQVDVLSLTIDPKNSSNVFAGTVGRGILRSQNNADNWQQTSLKQGSVNTIAIDPKDNNNIYAGVNLGSLGKIYKSTDGGANFSEIYSETHAKIDIKSILIDHFNPKIIYTGLTNGAFLKSSDAGQSWLATNWFGGPIEVMGMSPLDSRLIYVAVEGRYAYKTKDAGKTWEDLKDSLVDFRGANLITAIAFDPKKVNVVYFGSHFGIVKSNNEGKSWKDLGLLLEPGKFRNIALIISTKNPGTIYAGVDTTIHKSVDFGANWNIKKITNNNITSLAIDPQKPMNVYAGIQEVKD